MRRHYLNIILCLVTILSFSCYLINLSKKRRKNDSSIRRTAILKELNLSGSNVHRLKEIIEGNRDRPEPLQYSIKLSHEIGDWKQIYSDATKLQERFPYLPDGWVFQGIALRYMQRSHDAENILRAGLRKFPRVPDISIQLGLLLHDNKRFEDATKHWARLWKIHPNNSLICRNFADALIATEQVQSASELLEDAILIFPDDSNILIKYAEIANISQSWVEAARRWKMVLDRFPGRWEPYLYLSRALSHLGKRNEALVLLETAMAAFPNQKPIREEYVQVTS